MQAQGTTADYRRNYLQNIQDTFRNSTGSISMVIEEAYLLDHTTAIHLKAKGQHMAS
jgi:uncharacterized protein YnzC (UPF0291/DUF896 family)